MGILRQHLANSKPSPDNCLIRVHAGDVLPAVTRRRAFAAARAKAFTTGEAASPALHHIYDLRHACLPCWLSARVPATQVESAGNSVDVLLKVYAKYTDGEQHLHKQRVQAAATWFFVVRAGRRVVQREW